MSATVAEQPGPTGYGDLIRGNENFRWLWFGQIVSLLGDWFNLIASAALIASLTQSGIAVGGLFVVRMLAPFLVSPFAGVAADRYNRKKLLVLTDLGRALAVTGFLLVREPEHVWLLYALTAVQLGMSGFFFPARNAILPDIVSSRELGAANALTAATWSVMLAFGAALGGIVAGAFGAYPAFVIDALTFLVSAVLIGRIAYDVKPGLAATDQSIGAAVRQYYDGLRYLWRNTDFLIIASHKAAFALTMGGAFQVVQVAMAEEVFVIGEGGGIGLGLMLAFMGVGTGVGPILARRFTGDRDRSMRAALTLSYGLGALGVVLIAPLSNFGVVLVGSVLRGVGGGIIWVFATQLLLQLVPGQMRGRVFASEFALFTLMTAVASAGGGWLLDSTGLGLSGILWVMAVVTLIPGALWLLWNLAGGPGETRYELEEGPAAPVATAEQRQEY